MKKWIRRIGIALIVLLGLVLLLAHGGMYFMQFSDAKAQAFFEEHGFQGKIEYLTVGGRKVKVVVEDATPEDSILLVFVHGAPGSWDAFKKYMVDSELYSRTRVVSYDRPGYGGSGREAMPGIQDQAEVLKEIIRHYDLAETILVGHSYGGPIAGYCALHPDLNIRAAIMIAPLIDPVSEPIFWYSYFSYWEWSSWLLPNTLQVAGSEKFAHAEELATIEDQWASATDKIIHVHGLEDALAPGAENVDFSKQHIPESNLELVVYPEKGHLIIWTAYGLMKAIILSTLRNDQG